MKNLIFITVLVLLFTHKLQAQKDVLYKISSSVEMIEPFTSGYVNSLGDTIIPVGKYIQCYTNVFDKIAIVSIKGLSGYYAIDRNEKILFQVSNCDNGPDNLKDNLFRIIKNKKIGYANMDGEIVIKPQFDLALPFDHGYAAFCVDGHNEKKGDYDVQIGGKWGVINTSGNVIIKPIYDMVSLRDIKYGKIRVKKNGEWIYLNTK